MGPPPEKKPRLEGEAPADEEKPAEPDAEMPAEQEEPAKEAEEVKPEPPKELEEDAPPEKAKPRIKEAVKFLVADTTLNVMQSTTGNLLMTLCDGGIQHLFAGARANVGVKSGRYMFEVKIVEYMNPVEDQGSRTASRPKNLLRVGFSLSSSPLIMGETSEGFVCFDSEGAFVQPKKRAPVAGRFVRDEVVAVLLNLDDSSPNHNTISLFKDGVRITAPQPLPEELHGQTLYPTVSFKQMTVHANFGPEPITPLPFVCRMVGDASAKDAEVSPTPKDSAGKKEVLFPVGLPDEGTFDWLDNFHANNPGYTELSDRMILDWAEKSGIWRQKNYKSSNDKPEMGFGLRELDDGSIRRVIHTVAPLQARNFLVMEVKGNLTKGERKETLSHFPTNCFTKKAVVIVGEPTADIKKKTHDIILKKKQDEADIEFRAKKAEEMRKKLIEKRNKELEKAKKRAEKEKRKVERELKRKIEADKKAREAAEKKAAEEKKKAEKAAAGEEEEKEDEEMEQKEEEAEEKKEEEKEEEEEEEEEEPEEEEKEENEEPPKVELTAEEKKIFFVKGTIPDLTPWVLSTSLAQFSLPEKEDGFDEIKYEWTKTSSKAQEYLKTWILDKKLTTRVEDLNPSEWFQSKWVDWQKALQQWHSKHTEYKAMVAKKEAAKTAKKAAAIAKEAAAKREAAAKEAREAAAAAAKEAREAAAAAAKEAAAAAKEGEEKEEEAAPMEEEKEKEKEEEEKKEEEKEEEKEDEEMEEELDFDNIDVFGVDDVLNVGASTPLFKDFNFEDWTMMGLRFELHLLAHAFKHDVSDPERLGIHLDHLAFYYNKYFKKALNPKSFGVETTKDLMDFVSDAVFVTKKQVLESQLDAEMECPQIFVKLTEEARRYRNLKLALGDESARLKLSHAMQFTPNSNFQRGGGGGGGKRGGGGGAKGGGGGGGWYDKGNQKGGKPYGGVGGFHQQFQPRTVRPPTYRQPWNDSKGKGK